MNFVHGAFSGHLFNLWGFPGTFECNMITIEFTFSIIFFAVATICSRFVVRVYRREKEQYINEKKKKKALSNVVSLAIYNNSTLKIFFAFV